MLCARVVEGGAPPVNIPRAPRGSSGTTTLLHSPWLRLRRHQGDRVAFGRCESVPLPKASDKEACRGWACNFEEHTPVSRPTGDQFEVKLKPVIPSYPSRPGAERLVQPSPSVAAPGASYG